MASWATMESTRGTRAEAGTPSMLRPHNLRSARASTRTLASWCALSLALLVLAPSAFGHASLESVTPNDGAALESPPAEVVIEFTADVADNVKEAALLGPNGAKIDDAWAARGPRITIVPTEALADGAWTVEWRVLGGDGHPLTGSSAFTVASTAADVATGGGAAPSSSVPEEPSASAHAGHVMASTYPHTALERVALAGRILFFGGLLVFVGGVLFATIAAPGWQPRFWSASLLSIVAGAWIVLATHAAMLEERSVWQMLNPGVWITDMVSVGVRGYVLAAVLALVVHVLRWQLEPAEWEERSAALPWLLLVLVAGSAMAPSLSGHAADGSMLWVRIPLDMLHVLAGAAWLGGLVQLLTIAKRERSLDPRMYPVVNRYSTMAAVSVGVLVVTGVFATFNELDAGIGELFGSTWGRLILLKVVLLGATMPLANANRLRNVPDVSHDPLRGVPKLRRFVAIELIIIVWVVGATAMLVYETPPKSDAAGTTHAASVPSR